jgi:PAS domain S-box-containing protein
VTSLPIDPTADPQDALRTAADRLHVALEAGRMGAWEWNVRTGQVSWSPTLERIHGLAVGSFDGTFEAYQSDIHPEDKERVLNIIKESMHGQRAHHLEYRIIRPDGETRWLEAHGRLFTDTEDKPLRMMGVCMDVTARKQDELETQRLAEEMKRIGEFRERLIGIVAHDLRNPLNTISMGARSFVAAPDFPEQYARTASRIARSADRMSRMISDLLDFAHGKLSGSLPTTIDDVDLGDVAQRIVEELEITHTDRAIFLETQGNLRGRWDGERLAQVVANLAGNALKHGEGPVRVRVRSEQNVVSIEVHNSGSPIDPEALPTLFLPFRRATSRTEGLGLGLYIVSEIVRAHHGTIRVSSTAEGGTAFTVSLPRDPTPKRRADRAEQASR